MKRDPLPAHVLATRLIPNVSPDMAKEFGLTPDQKSLALITADCDDVTYTALDEATKKADCKVVYAKSFYGGAANANTALAGEIIGILAAPNPAEAKAGLEAAVDMIENVCHFVSANDDDSICYYRYATTAPAPYYAMLQEKLALLEESGVVICPQEELEDYILNEKKVPACKQEKPAEVKPVAAQKEYRLTKRVITERDVSEACTAKATCIRIPANSIVTDLAKDFARSRDISLIRE